MEQPFQDIAAHLREEPLIGLLRIYAALEQEFLHRGMIRKRQEVVSGYTEMLVCERLWLVRGGRAATPSTPAPVTGTRFKGAATKGPISGSAGWAAPTGGWSSTSSSPQHWPRLPNPTRRQDSPPHRRRNRRPAWLARAGRPVATVERCGPEANLGSARPV